MSRLSQDLEERAVEITKQDEFQSCFGDRMEDVTDFDSMDSVISDLERQFVDENDTLPLQGQPAAFENLVRTTFRKKVAEMYAIYMCEEIQEMSSEELQEFADQL